jgi:hypothetical protein
MGFQIHRRAQVERAASFGALFAVLLLADGCGGGQEAVVAPGDPDDPAYAASFDGDLDPRISTSAGEAGGLVVLWPRVVPAEGGLDAAQHVASFLAAAAREAAGDRPVDVRPDPERACPRDGCAAASIGAVLLHRGDQCAVVATVAVAGPAPSLLVPLAAEVTLRNTNVPFRTPPEEHVVVRDYGRCSELASALEEQREMLVAEIHNVLR